MKNSRQSMPNLTDGLFLGVFCCFPYFLSISLNFWPKNYTWLENSGNEDSNATFLKSVGDTSKHTDFYDGGVREVWSIAESLSYDTILKTLDALLLYKTRNKNVWFIIMAF